MATKQTPPEMTIERVRDLIQAENPKARTDDVEMYAQQFMTYLEAAENIAINGTICAHPRTAQPMENPYVKIRTGAANAMQKIARLRTSTASGRPHGSTWQR